MGELSTEEKVSKTGFSVWCPFERVMCHLNRLPPCKDCPAMIKKESVLEYWRHTRGKQGGG